MSRQRSSSHHHMRASSRSRSCSHSRYPRSNHLHRPRGSPPRSCSCSRRPRRRHSGIRSPCSPASMSMEFRLRCSSHRRRWVHNRWGNRRHSLRRCTIHPCIRRTRRSRSGKWHSYLLPRSFRRRSTAPRSLWSSYRDSLRRRTWHLRSRADMCRSRRGMTNSSPKSDRLHCRRLVGIPHNRNRNSRSPRSCRIRRHRMNLNMLHNPVGTRRNFRSAHKSCCRKRWHTPHNPGRS